MNTTEGQLTETQLRLPIMLPLPDHPSFFAPKVQEEVLPQFSLEELMQQYCLCDLANVEGQAQAPPSFPKEESYMSSKDSKPKKNLMLKHGNFEEKAERLLYILQTITSKNVTLVTAKKKAESRRGPLSNKRSAYIGVSRNGPHWQALITIRKRKTYIGSYRSEIDAALAFDFYSLLLHALTAKTNFSYTKEDILAMIGNFKANENVLKPEQVDNLAHVAK